MQHILLLHGTIGSSAQLKSLQEQLQGSFDVHVLDFPGHGHKEMPTEFSIELFAESLMNFIREKEITGTDVFGYSMGGYVAMWLARHQPGMIGSIVTLGTKFYWDEATAAKEVKMLQPDVIEQKIPAFAQTLRERHADWKTVLERTAGMLQSMGDNNPLGNEDYRHIANKALVMIGELDKMVTMQETEFVANELPNGSLMVLPGAPHPIEQVNAAVLAETISKFIKESNQ